jgi:lysophospholipase L1-like esterase
LLSTKKRLFSLLMLVLVLVLCLGLGEIAVRLFSPQDLSGSPWTYLDPSGLQVNKASATVRHQLGRRVIHYRFNRHHARGAQLAEAAFRILVVGDSFTFGWLLAQEHTYVHLLQKAADRDLGPGRVQFVNAATAGWGAADYLAFVEQLGPAIRPRAVLVFINSDDIGRAFKSGLYALKGDGSLDLERGRSTKGGSVARIKRYTDDLALYQWLCEHSHLFNLLRKALLMALSGKSFRRIDQGEQPELGLPLSHKLTVEPSRAQDMGRAIFRRLKKWCDSHGAQLLVMTTGFNGLNRPADPTRPGEPTKIFLARAQEIFRREGIPFYDLGPQVAGAIGGKVEEYKIPIDGHPNERANRLVARYAWPWLRGRLAGWQTQTE